VGNLQGVVAKDLTGMHLADRVRARKALVGWIDELAEGKTDTQLAALAKREGLSLRALRKIMREDENLAKEVFGALNDEARIGLTKALAKGQEFIDRTPGVPGTDAAKEVRAWAVVFAKFLGGSYERAESQQGGGILNLITNIQLPAGFKEVPMKVLDNEDAARRMEGLL
jgi:hypothetical protein